MLRYSIKTLVTESLFKNAEIFMRSKYLKSYSRACKLVISSCIIYMQFVYVED